MTVVVEQVVCYYLAANSIVFLAWLLFSSPRLLFRCFFLLILLLFLFSRLPKKDLNQFLML